MDFMYILSRFFLLILSITIALKFDDKISLEWSEVFWSYWIILSVFVGLSFGFNLTLICKICLHTCCNVENNNINN